MPSTGLVQFCTTCAICPALCLKIPTVGTVLELLDPELGPRSHDVDNPVRFLFPSYAEKQIWTQRETLTTDGSGWWASGHAASATALGCGPQKLPLGAQRKCSLHEFYLQKILLDEIFPRTQITLLGARIARAGQSGLLHRMARACLAQGDTFILYGSH